MSHESKPSAVHGGVELAAGGLVWHDDGTGSRLAVVHRAKYDDWTLPKGRLEAGETLAEAAVREAEEETGWTVSANRFAGSVSYLKEGRPKVVLFWHMKRGQARREGLPGKQEVDDVAWLKTDQAIDRLTHPDEKDFVARHCIEPESNPPSQTT
jgi:8-oxo-dGTP pyrophosphatase MutT (NUDIX family)